MAFQIGTDEAGYGPNLGPLMICGTQWQVPSADINLYEALQRVVTNDCKHSDRITICDSKQVYKSSGSLKKIETVVLAMLFCISEQIPADLQQLASLLSCDIDYCPHQSFEICSSQLRLPVAASRSDIEHQAQAFLTESRRQQISLTGIRCTAVFPERFNKLVLDLGNKAEVLSAETMAIVHHLMQQAIQDVRIVCDKHGGRSKYLALINNYLTDEFVTIDCESRRLSRYHWQSSDTSFDLNFQAAGESFLPTALSSMVAKYLRELSMLIWNRFWNIKIPGIKPTKGYPVDARRFKDEIMPAQKALGIQDDLIWRTR